MITFTTPGPIPIEALTTFGVSAKEGENPIGFFGTGFKYAVAIVLRAGGSVRVETGGKVHAFSHRAAEIRGKEFDIVTLDGQDLGFTTDVGKTWEMWQAYRELHSNMLDEGGEVYRGPPKGKGWGAHLSHVVVDCPAFETAFQERSSIFLATEPLAKTTKLEIHPGRSEIIYYRGVRAAELKEPTRFTYNILSSLSLTEDRTFRYSFEAQHAIALAICGELTDEMLIRDIISPLNKFEACLIYSNPSDSFVSAVRTALANGRGVALNALDACRKKEPDLNATVELDDFEAKLLDDCIKRLILMGYQIDQYPIKIANHLQGAILGRAHEGTIWIAKELFDRGDREVMATLLEEWMHLQCGYLDGSRQMMDWCFQQIVVQGLRRIS